MTQEEVDLIFSITISIHENEWFGERKKPRGREEVQEWVVKNLTLRNVYTVPVGMSWGMLTSKEYFDEYWSENSKIK